MNSSWSDAFERLAGPLAVSLGLHLSVGAALEALPSRVSSALPEGQQQSVQRLQVALRGAPPPAATSEAPALPPVPPVPPLATPASAAGEPPETSPPARYFLARELDARPVALAPIDPAYPNDAYLRNIPGSVLVRLHLTETGAVEQAVILRADPPGYFEEAVQRAFLAGRFSPGMRGGRPVRVQMTIEVRYDSPRLEAAPGGNDPPAR